MGGAQRDQQFDAAVSRQPFYIVGSNQPPLGVADNRKLSAKVVFFVESFDLFVHVGGQVLNGIGIKSAENSPQVDAENSIAVIVEAALEDGKSSAGGAKTVEQKNRISATLKVGFSLDAVAAQG